MVIGLLAIGCTSKAPSPVEKVDAEDAATIEEQAPVLSVTLKEILDGVDLKGIKSSVPSPTSGVIGGKDTEAFRSSSDTVKFECYFFIPPGRPSAVPPYATKAVVSFSGNWT